MDLSDIETKNGLYSNSCNFVPKTTDSLMNEAMGYPHNGWVEASPFQDNKFHGDHVISEFSQNNQLLKIKISNYTHGHKNSEKTLSPQGEVLSYSSYDEDRKLHGECRSSIKGWTTSQEGLVDYQQVRLKHYHHGEPIITVTFDTAGREEVYTLNETQQAEAEADLKMLQFQENLEKKQNSDQKISLEKMEARAKILLKKYGLNS